MIISIHQPSYFPWLGLLDKIAKSELFVLLDDVQVNKDSYQFRNIFYCNGESKYLTLPVNYKHGIKFRDLEFKNKRWMDQHLNQLVNYYAKAPYKKVVIEDLKFFFESLTNKIPIDVIETTMRFCFEKLAITTKVIRSSEISYEGTKADMVLSICKNMGASTYLSGMGSFEYMQSSLDNFEKDGIQVIWHNFNHPKYKQNFQIPFIAGLSLLDLCFWQGYDVAKNIFWNNVHENTPLK